MNKVHLYTLTALLVGVIVVWSLLTNDNGQQEAAPAELSSDLEIKNDKLSLGNAEAPVKVVEFIDMLCPYCAKSHQEIMPKFKTEYIDTEKVHYETRLVAMIARDSSRAAAGAYCAAEQDKFWGYIDTAYRETWNNYYSQNKSPDDVYIFSMANIPSFASRVGVELNAWQDCVDSGKYDENLNANRQMMVELEAYGTPTFLINGHKYSGFVPYAAFKATVESELKRAGAA